MFDAEFLSTQLEDAIELVHDKLLASKPSNKQIWYILQAYSGLLRDYEAFMRAPKIEAMAGLQTRIAALEAKAELLQAQGQVRTLGIGKTGIGGAQ